MVCCTYLKAIVRCHLISIDFFDCQIAVVVQGFVLLVVL
jgi:hypothetical protein